MDLRSELLPPPVPQQRLEEIKDQIEGISDLVLGSSPDADDAVAAFNAEMGHTYTAADFAEYDGYRSLRRHRSCCVDSERSARSTPLTERVSALPARGQ